MYTIFTNTRTEGPLLKFYPKKIYRDKREIIIAALVAQHSANRLIGSSALNITTGFSFYIL